MLILKPSFLIRQKNGEMMWDSPLCAVSMYCPHWLIIKPALAYGNTEYSQVGNSN